MEPRTNTAPVAGRRDAHPAAIALVFLVAGALAAAGCGGDKSANQSTEDASKTLHVVGSDTMLYLSRDWAEAFEKANPGTTVNVVGGGSGRGIAALLNGEAHLANASRPMREREKFLLLQAQSKTAREYPVALDALAVFVHTENPVTSLSTTQLRDIYSGAVTNWNQVGGPDQAIVVYNRDEASGTYAYFQDHVMLGAAYTGSAETIPETAKIIEAVKGNIAGIGYGGVAYVDKAEDQVHELRISTTDPAAAIAPTLDNAVSGLYPLARLLYIYSAGTPGELEQKYLEFVRSAEGQRIIESIGYYPLPDEIPERITAREHAEADGTTVAAAEGEAEAPDPEAETAEAAEAVDEAVEDAPATTAAATPEAE